MAGILANSPSVSMTSGTADAAQAGFVVGEQVVLTTLPVASSTYAWSLAIPAGSAAARSGLDDDDAASARFTPDVAGVYTAVCTVDGVTAYVLRMAATLRASASVAQAHRYSPVTDSSVAAPSVGRTLYFSSDQDALVVKDPNGDLFEVQLTAI
jgi:hypothetical protein